jgi:hypothetical protein
MMVVLILTGCAVWGDGKYVLAFIIAMYLINRSLCDVLFDRLDFVVGFLGIYCLGYWVMLPPDSAFHFFMAAKPFLIIVTAALILILLSKRLDWLDAGYAGIALCFWLVVVYMAYFVLVLNEFNDRWIGGLMPIYVAYFLVLSVLILQKWASKIHYLALIVVTVIAMLLLGSRAALLSLMVVIAFDLKRRFRLNWIVVGMLGPVITIAAGYLVYVYSIYFRDQNLLEFGEIDRFLFLTSAWRFIEDNFSLFNWIFGWGPGRTMSGFWLDGKLEAWVAGSFIRRGDRFAFIVHNDVLRLFLDFGMVGMVLLIYLVGKLGWKSLVIVPMLMGGQGLYSDVNILCIATLLGIERYNANVNVLSGNKLGSRGTGGQRASLERCAVVGRGVDLGSQRAFGRVPLGRNIVSSSTR